MLFYLTTDTNSGVRSVCVMENNVQAGVEAQATSYCECENIG